MASCVVLQHPDSAGRAEHPDGKLGPSSGQVQRPGRRRPIRAHRQNARGADTDAVAGDGVAVDVGDSVLKKEPGAGKLIAHPLRRPDLGIHPVPDVDRSYPVIVTVAKRGVLIVAADLLALIDHFNIATDGTMVVPADYLEVVVTKRAG